jgi:hypothetical protein
MFRSSLSFLLILGVALTGCASLDRDDDAAKAKTRMLGMTREDVLSCMGPPKKKAYENKTEVWSYLSSDRGGQTSGDTFHVTGYGHSESSHSKNFCLINVVMKDGTVSAIHYLGPAASYFYTNYDQCGYAVKDCVE